MQYTLDLYGLHKWIKSQPPEKEYDWTDPETCLLREFGNMMGFASYNEISIAFINDDMAIINTACSQPWTYGDALKRLEGHIAEKEKRSAKMRAELATG